MFYSQAAFIHYQAQGRWSTLRKFSRGSDANVGKELAALSTSDTEYDFHLSDSESHCKHFRARVFSLYMLGSNLLFQHKQDVTSFSPQGHTEVRQAGVCTIP